jgi:TonB family protein
MTFKFAAAAIAFWMMSSAGWASPPWKVPKENYGGAVPSNLDRWLNYTDYPDGAARAGEQGYVTVSFTIGVDGRMTNCQVVHSSGFSVLDAVPCKVLPKRARFIPAKDAAGAPVATRGSTSMSFWTQP